MVENEDLDMEVDDTLSEGIEEEQDESEQSLDSLTGEEETRPDEEQQNQDSQSASEPGWIKKRVEKAVSKAVAETERRMREEFDRQMAPLREKALNDEARELVRQGEFKSLDRAKEYLQLKQGLPVQPSSEEQPQPRNEKGQYTARNDNSAVQARIDMLQHQADQIKADGGPDVISEFRNNKEINEKVKSGEMDFYDVAKAMKQPSRRPPAPMRSPNGASGQQRNAIDTMTDEMFDRMEKRISEGARYSLK